MEGNPIISEALVKTCAYKDLDKPTILANGELGIYYINSEKLLQDGGAWKTFGNNSSEMINHASDIADNRHRNPNREFAEVINVLTEETKKLFSHSSLRSNLISGGQRRDWIFSGPVARRLGVPHLSLYKDGWFEIIFGNKVEILDYHYLSLAPVVHIVDMLTEGSSCYSACDGKEEGWIPMIRNLGGKIDNLVAVVTRLQGGEENLRAQGVTTHPQVAIDEEFLRKYSNNSERAVAYFQNPKAWSENYLTENGAVALLPSFNPQGGKLDRARKFILRYKDVLQGEGMNELEKAIQKEYNMPLNSILNPIQDG